MGAGRVVTLRMEGEVTGAGGRGLAGGPCSGRTLLGPTGTIGGFSMVNLILKITPGSAPEACILKPQLFLLNQLWCSCLPLLVNLMRIGLQ